MARPICLETTKVSLPVASFLIPPSTNAIMPWLTIAFVKRLLLMSFGSFTSVERSIQLMSLPSFLVMLLSGHLSNPFFFGVDSHHKLRPSLSFGMGNQLLYKVAKHLSYRGECQLEQYFLLFRVGLHSVVHLLIVLFQGLLPRKSVIRNIFVGKLQAKSSEENPPK
jgi:hypothetical protein